MIVSEFEDINESVLVTYSHHKCDKCNGDGMVRYGDTVNERSIFIKALKFISERYHPVVHFTTYEYYRDLVYRKMDESVLCPKCLGKRNIAVIN